MEPPRASTRKLTRKSCLAIEPASLPALSTSASSSSSTSSMCLASTLWLETLKLWSLEWAGDDVLDDVVIEVDPELKASGVATLPPAALPLEAIVVAYIKLMSFYLFSLRKRNFVRHVAISWPCFLQPRRGFFLTNNLHALMQFLEECGTQWPNTFCMYTRTLCSCKATCLLRRYYSPVVSV